MGEKMTPALMELEMKRKMISEQEVAMTLDPGELLNSRIPGLCIVYEDAQDRDADSLSIVEDYVRSLGQPGKASDKANDDGETDMFGVRLIDTGSPKSRVRRSADRPGKGRAGVSFADNRAAAEPTSEWMSFSAALDDGHHECVWFRLSLNLLAELCKDRNAYTQRIVGSVLPAECLIAVLEVRASFGVALVKSIVQPAAWHVDNRRTPCTSWRRESSAS
jgi:hypothetical protein